MKYLLALAVAFSLTLVWQTSSRADRPLLLQDVGHEQVVKHSPRTVMVDPYRASPLR
ncbi:MAG: hypothetical protein HPY30_18010 [Gammaproteobacteria bacterium (ex Lamellibrachia satsuma)]|nr:MAG: hypothetical protein HPY30_18010 [Gammaproteobacteria bacterium (ex Lamellibrachia satsuma)]